MMVTLYNKPFSKLTQREKDDEIASFVATANKLKRRTKKQLANQILKEVDHSSIKNGLMLEDKPSLKNLMKCCDKGELAEFLIEAYAESW